MQDTRLRLQRNYGNTHFHGPCFTTLRNEWQFPHIIPSINAQHKTGRETWYCQNFYGEVIKSMHGGFFHGLCKFQLFESLLCSRWMVFESRLPKVISNNEKDSNNHKSWICMHKFQCFSWGKPAIRSQKAVHSNVEVFFLLKISQKQYLIMTIMTSCDSQLHPQVLVHLKERKRKEIDQLKRPCPCPYFHQFYGACTKYVWKHRS